MAGFLRWLPADLELAEDARTDGVALVFGDQIAIGALVQINVEVVILRNREDFVNWRLL